ncbi:hypothetical protein D3C86_921650 [compost metagenome]
MLRLVLVFLFYRIQILHKKREMVPAPFPFFYAISGSPNVSFQNYLGFCCNLELVITSWGISKVNLLSFGKSV